MAKTPPRRVEQRARTTPPRTNVYPLVPLNLWQRAIDFPYVRPPPVEQMPPLAYLEKHPAYAPRPDSPGWGTTGWDWGQGPGEQMPPGQRMPPGRNLWDRSDPFATPNLRGLRNWYSEGTHDTGAVPAPLSQRVSFLRALLQHSQRV